MFWCSAPIAALDPTTPWSLTDRSSGKSLVVDWSSFPNDLDVAFFIASLNQTEINEDNDHHHHHHEPNNPIRMLRVFNKSKTEVNVSGIPAATEFEAVVFLVTNTDDVYKSQRLTITSAEGGKLFLLAKLYCTDDKF